VLREEAYEVGVAATPDRVRDECALVRIGAVLEQQADVLEAVLVERVPEGVRACGRRAVREQEAQALRAFRLCRVVKRLAVVGIGPRLEEYAR
jgi:hypothetical protein